jgi:ribosomal protein S18 acetylase RimI-like enzyme
MPFSIVPASTAEHFETARTLFREYQLAIDTDLCFQSFEQEVAGLPGKYAPPRGTLLIAWLKTEDGKSTPAGVIAMRPLVDDVCEMKRLYVRPLARGHNLGRSLIEHLIEAARGAGYRKMRLDTLSDKMARAIALYREFGFHDISPYFDSPLANELFLELDLTARARTKHG